MIPRRWSRPSSRLSARSRRHRSTPRARRCRLATGRRWIPPAKRPPVRATLGERIADLDGVLGLARDFARKYEPANWRQFVERCQVISGEIERLYALAGINEDDEAPDEPMRADLAKPVIWNWSEDREATSHAEV